MNLLDHLPIQIVPATEQDLPAVLAIFDAAVSWLVTQGLTGQWGTEPFSQYPARVEQFAAWIRAGALYVARADETILGTLVIGTAPPSYAAKEWAQMPRRALYLEAFATDRRYAGQGVGRLLLQWAAQCAREQQIDWLRLDCWAGNPALRRYYEQAGFVACGGFRVGDWQGALYEKPVVGADSG